VFCSIILVLNRTQEDMSFAINARYALITYSQCGELSEWSIVERFSELGAECIVARELHADGGTHLHVFVDFGRKFRSRKANVFDVDGWHPNISASRGTPEKGYDYAIKDGDVVAGGLERPHRAVSSGSTHSKWSEIESASTREEFWDLLAELDPMRMLTSWTTLSKYADWRFAPVIAEYESDPRLSFISGESDGRDEWLSQSGIGLGVAPLGM
jgi:hypothetical protein